MAVGEDPAEVVEATVEAQRYGDRLVRLMERTAVPIADAQYTTLSEHDERLEWFGLRLTVELDGSHWLHASDRVGSYRFVANDGNEVVVQVDPKIESADVFRMLDRTNRTADPAAEDTDFPVGHHAVSGVFLLYFAGQIRPFLERNRFRAYRFLEEASASRPKGRPLVREYALDQLPRGRAHVLPTRHLDLTPNVFENQVIAYAVLLASRLVQLLGLEGSEPLRRQLHLCRGLLAGVEPRRVTADELRAYRASRASRHFNAVHQLCLVLLENHSVMFEPGERVPFAAFSLDMPSLFERYVRAVFAAALGTRFEGRRSKLEYPTGFGGKPIRLDGLIAERSRRIVVEAKYRNLAGSDDDLVLGRVPERHVYQTVSYASHESIRARQAVIVYPTWEKSGPPVQLSDAISDFGWSRFGHQHLDIRLLGLDLGADFHALVRDVEPLLRPLIDAA